MYIAVAALGLALFAVPDAHGWWHSGPDMSLRVSGSNFITSSTPDGTPTPLGFASTSMQSGIAKGKSGRSIFTAQTIIDMAGALPDLCGLLPGAGLSTTTVFTYNDGSILSLATASNVEGELPTSYYCYDPSTGVFSVEFEGIITGGERRFEGATGTWEGTATAQDARLTADIDLDLD